MDRQLTGSDALYGSCIVRWERTYKQKENRYNRNTGENGLTIKLTYFSISSTPKLDMAIKNGYQPVNVRRPQSISSIQF